MQIAFRSMCVAVLSKAVMWNINEASISTMATKLVQLLKAGELEKLDCYLHEAGAPGLHVLVAGLSGEKGRRTVRRAISSRVDKGLQKNSVLLYVLEPLGLAKARTIFSEMVAGPSVTREEFAALMYAGSDWGDSISSRTLLFRGRHFQSSFRSWLPCWRAPETQNGDSGHCWTRLGFSMSTPPQKVSMY